MQNYAAFITQVSSSCISYNMYLFFPYCLKKDFYYLKQGHNFRSLFVWKRSRGLKSQHLPPNTPTP